MIVKDKVIIVTGSDGMLGKQIVKEIKSEGGIVIQLDIKNTDDSSNNILHFDINSDNSINKVINFIKGKYGKIDGLVNNAYPRTSDWNNKLEDVSNDSFSKNLDMQLSRIFSITKPVLIEMKKVNKGSIVNIGSIYGIVGNDFTIYENTEITSPVAYSAIKGGLINLNRYIASYVGKYNLRSNVVSPGGVFNQQDKIFVSNYEKRVPMKRMAFPEDISPIVVFLLSEKSNYITGQNIAVDGGWTAI